MTTLFSTDSRPMIAAMKPICPQSRFSHPSASVPMKAINAWAMVRIARSVAARQNFQENSTYFTTINTIPTSRESPAVIHAPTMREE